MEYWKSWLANHPKATDQQVMETACHYINQHPDQLTVQCIEQLEEVIAQWVEDNDDTSDKEPMKQKRKRDTKKKKKPSFDVKGLLDRLRAACNAPMTMVSSANQKTLDNLDEMMAAAKRELTQSSPGNNVVLPNIRANARHLTIMEHLIRGWYLEMAHQFKHVSYADAARQIGCAAKNPTSSDSVRRARLLYGLVINDQLHQLRRLQDPTLITLLLKHRVALVALIQSNPAQKEWWSQNAPDTQQAYIPYTWFLE